jgi:spoIIIJ-associated protein
VSESPEAAAAESDPVGADVPSTAVDELGVPADPAGEAAAATVDAALLEREGDVAADYIEVLLDVADLDGDIDMDVEGERAMVSVVGASLEQLVGPRGEVLEALQELTRLAVHRETGVRSRLMVDIGGWRVHRRDELAEVGRRTAEQVQTSGESVMLEPMTPFERKAVHDAVSAIAGVRTESEGEEPNRRIVIYPAAG